MTSSSASLAEFVAEWVGFFAGSSFVPATSSSGGGGLLGNSKQDYLHSGFSYHNMMTLSEPVGFFLFYLVSALMGLALFLLDANPANAGYVTSHFVWPEDCPLEVYELLYNPFADAVTSWFTLGSWIWPNRANLKTRVVDSGRGEQAISRTAASGGRNKSGRSDRSTASGAITAQNKHLHLEPSTRKGDSGRRGSNNGPYASPVFRNDVVHKSGAVIVEKARDSTTYQKLPVEECEFPMFPPHKLDTNIWFKLRVVWGYLKITAAAVVKENLWLIQYLLRIDPGYTFFMRSKRTGFQALFIEHAYQMYEDCWNRPICSAPSNTVTVLYRERKNQPALAPYLPLTMTERSVKCTNLGSYNYLGFGGVDEYCTPLVAKCIRDIGLSSGGTRGSRCGTVEVHKELEQKVANFLDKEDAYVVGMGFATNSTIIPCLVDPQGNGKGCLIISDELNHKSIIEGVRMSWVTVKAFLHNDMVDLEQKLKQACDVGQPNGKPWRKIIVIVEGIYSMEGDFCRLREIVALKDKYGAYLYLDEAHSIGAVGSTGRGITDLLNVPREKVDIMMGTFTKSFGSAGGYIAADAGVIANLRKNSPNATFAPSMSPACAAQALAAFELLGTERGKEKINGLRNNSNHFRKRLAEIGFWVLGDEDSPVVPVLMDQESMWYFSVDGMKSGIAVVVVCAPATPYMLPRARFCVSAAHTRTQIDATLEKLEALGKRLGILFRKNDPCLTNPDYYAWLRDAPLTVQKYAKQPKFEPLATAAPSSNTASASSPVALTAQPAAAPSKENETTKLSKISGGGAVEHQGGATAVAVFEASGEPSLAVIHEEAAKRKAGRGFSFSAFDPLGLIQMVPKRLPDACDAYLTTHGFGTCGPRGFYGTTLEHLALEKALATTLDTEAAIFYAQGVSVASSVLASPMLGAKDLVFCFTKCHYGIKSGLRLNGKCTLVFIEDMRELSKWLSSWRQVERIDKEKVGFRDAVSDMLYADLPDRFRKMEREVIPLQEYNKRFVVAEGLYQADGSVLDLPKLRELKSSYQLSLIVDESLSLGGLAPRGVTEYFYGAGRGAASRAWERASSISTASKHSESVQGGARSWREDDPGAGKGDLVSSCGSEEERLTQRPGGGAADATTSAKNDRQLVPASKGARSSPVQRSSAVVPSQPVFLEESDASVIDIYLGSLEFAVGSIGGFCAGAFHAVRDLRLTSSGYCFSASAPGVSCLWSRQVVDELAECRAGLLSTGASRSAGAVEKSGGSLLPTRQGGSRLPSLSRADSPSVQRAMKARARAPGASGEGSAATSRHSLSPRSGDGSRCNAKNPLDQLVPPITTKLCSASLSRESASAETTSTTSDNNENDVPSSSEAGPSELGGDDDVAFVNKNDAEADAEQEDDEDLVQNQKTGVVADQLSKVRVASSSKGNSGSAAAMAAMLSMSSPYGWTRDGPLKDRVAALERNVRHLQISARHVLSEKYSISGESYILHLRPKILVSAPKGSPLPNSAQASGASSSSNGALDSNREGASTTGEDYTTSEGEQETSAPSDREGLVSRSQSGTESDEQEAQKIATGVSGETHTTSPCGAMLSQVAPIRFSRSRAVCERTYALYSNALENVQKETGLDIYQRPEVEKALDTRLAIDTDWTPTLRVAVTSMHTLTEIDAIMHKLRLSATW
ncbi:unnamed protein product [Amoebophrya sp. A25]|nr:unnamed protein product [Amoebophrya sp. A25]|eukprot:GSA25T00000149001.1